MAKIKTIGILTSGGDAPGMNAAIRAVTRSAIYNGFTVKGIYRGYDGLINDEIKTFSTENVSGIIGTGGTMLKTARSKEFMTEEGRQKAFETIQKEEIDALVVIGGNGSLTGAMNFAREFDVCCIGLPGTIDNDLYGTDNTIGYDTTMNTIVECVDRIRDTAQSHERIFFIEVMGRDAGFLAQNSAIASGAEAAIIPEEEAIDLMKKAAKATYGRKGDKIVQMNYDAIDAGAKQVVAVEVPESWKSCEDEGLFSPEVKGGREDAVKFVKNIQAKVNAQEGNTLPVSAFTDYVDGSTPSGTAAYEKRGIAVDIPVWKSENCILK